MCAGEPPGEMLNVDWFRGSDSSPRERWPLREEDWGYRTQGFSEETGLRRVMPFPPPPSILDVNEELWSRAGLPKIYPSVASFRCTGLMLNNVIAGGDLVPQVVLGSWQRG